MPSIAQLCWCAIAIVWIWRCSAVYPLATEVSDTSIALCLSIASPLTSRAPVANLDDRGVCWAQGAMNLSYTQKHSLRECRRRLIAESEAARGRREELWQQLGCRMVGDDNRTSERIAQVRDDKASGSGSLIRTRVRPLGLQADVSRRVLPTADFLNESAHHKQGMRVSCRLTIAEADSALGHEHALCLDVQLNLDPLPPPAR